MKLKFKRIASILASAILLGSTAGFASVAADLGAYPKPFVDNGVASVSIVYGQDALAIDSASASLFTSDLASELASQTSTGTTGSASMGGEGIALSLSSRQIYYHDPLNVARSTLTETHLPTILAKGKAMDKTGIAYPYTQKVTLLTSNLTFGKSAESIDPILYINLGTTSTNGLYNYTVTFDKNININGSSVTGYTTLNLQGKSYLIGPQTANATLELYESGTSVTIEKGKEQKVTLDGVEHTLLLEGTDTALKAYLKVDGVKNTITEGSSSTFAGDVVVYVKTVFNAAVAGDIGWADVVVGKKKLKMTNGAAVTYLKEGTETTMDNTYVSISTTDGHIISAFTIGQATPTSIHDYLAVGDSFTDRVLGGLKVDYSATTPALDSAARDSVVVKTNGCEKVEVTFTSALAGSGSGKYAASGPEATFPYSMDSSGSCSTTAAPLLRNDQSKAIHLKENESVQIDELVVVNDEDEGRILQLISAGLGSAASDVTKFRDVITNEELEFATGTNNYSSLSKGAATYYVKVNEPTGGLSPSVTINWGAGASASGYNTPGDVTTLFPRIKLKGGSWMAILANTTITNATTYSMPGTQLLSDYKAGKVWTWPSTTPQDSSNATSLKFGNVNYTTAPGNMTRTTAAVNGLSMYSLMAGLNCSFSTALGPAILIVEPKRQALGETDGHAICIPLTTFTSGVAKVAVDYPVFTDTNIGEFQNNKNNVTSLYSAKLSPNSHIKQIVDRYGTFVEYNMEVNSGYKATVKLPTEMMLVDVFMAEVAAKASVSESTASGVVKLGDVILTDTEAEAQKPTTNLIVIGGSAVNKVAAKLLSVDYPTYAEDKAWQDATGVTGKGKAIIKMMASPYLSTQKAMLVAGWSGADTMAAAKEVINKKTGLSGLDEKVIGTTVTVA